MTTNNPQPTNDDLKCKLIEQRLKIIETNLENLNKARKRDKNQTVWLAIAIMGWSAMATAFVTIDWQGLLFGLEVDWQWLVFWLGMIGVILGLIQSLKAKKD